MTERVKVKLTRPTMISGQRVEAGRIVELAAQVAVEIVAVGKAEWLDDGDAPAARAAARAHTLRQLSDAGRGTMAAGASPWQPWR